MASEEDRLEEILKVLDGMEINSTHWQGTVMVHEGMIVQGGIIVESMPTLGEARILLNEATLQEFGTDEELAALIDEEFGDEDAEG